MLYHERSEDYRPLFWVNGHPVYVNTLIVVSYIAAFILGGIALFSLGYGAVIPLILSTDDVVHYGQVWRLVSYIIFLPTDTWTAINFIFAMGFLFYFGRQVEEFVGRKIFFNLFAALVLVPAILLCLIGLLWPQSYIGGYGIIFGVFIAFATIYPGVEICIWFVNLTAKGWAYVLLGCLSVVYFAQHAWIGLGGLWADAGIAYLGMRYIGAGRGFERITDWLDERRTQKLARQRNFKVLEDKMATDSIDAILEKISRQGVGSLTPGERATLERARANLLKRDQR